MKTALISVYDKTGIVEFAKKLVSLGVEIISTGGTYKTLRNAGVKVVEVADLTGFPECLDGRVKTLHPTIHAGILARRDNKNHMKHLLDLGINPIDMVVCNLYPFKETIAKKDVTLEQAIENIDIGGPTMLRAAAKNYPSVTVITDPADYDHVIKELKKTGKIQEETNFHLAQKVFEQTAAYDALIADYLKKQRQDDTWPEKFTPTFELVQEMRYGENPHQAAAFYREVGANVGSLTTAEQLNGKELSFNNINDANGALELLKEFDEPTVVAVKHANPCGVGSADNIYDAWMKAYSADKMSIFGGIVAINRTVTKRIAESIAENKIFLEILIAPDYEPAALEVLKKKKDLRILKLPNISTPQRSDAFDLKKVNGGLIVQSIDNKTWDKWQVVTKKKPTKSEIRDLEFAMKIVKYVKSNGIMIAKNLQSLGIGPGQVNRVWAAQQAIDHAHELIGPDVTRGAVLASDAFFPFADSVEAAHAAGITAIIQPGGSLNDQDSIDACNKYGIAMVTTGMRHFRH
ncbi:bifunctional phosphoribosylaminoimidazolecarboxamide formyltransferase/IMP cyclohydrolase [Candidatus Saccharibacteria bacterium]|nr:bifunctional phosphoribosylaminoimidazolecarboxamide formyltransferase/IMP cyclohydrolase [Candidatus Saccharibacteria bacterium]